MNGDFFRVILKLFRNRFGIFSLGETSSLNHCSAGAIEDLLTDFDYVHNKSNHPPNISRNLISTINQQIPLTDLI